MITEVESKHQVNPNNIREVEVELMHKYNPPAFDSEGEEIILAK